MRWTLWMALAGLAMVGCDDDSEGATGSPDAASSQQDATPGTDASIWLMRSVISRVRSRVAASGSVKSSNAVVFPALFTAGVL